MCKSKHGEHGKEIFKFLFKTFIAPACRDAATLLSTLMKNVNQRKEELRKEEEQRKVNPRKILMLDGAWEQSSGFADNEGDNDLQALCKELALTVLKGPASYTACGQSLDVGPIFMALRKLFNNSPEHRVNEDVMQYLEATLDSPEFDCVKNNKKHLLIDIVRRLQPVLNKALSTENVKQSFEKAGVWPLSLDQTLHQNKAFKSLTNAEVKTVRVAVPILTARLR